jgi:hypothetical protein
MRIEKKNVNRYVRYEYLLKEVGEQSNLNQKISSKPSRTVDFALRFVLLTKSKFKIHTFNNHYESQYKINGYKKEFELIF